MASPIVNWYPATVAARDAIVVTQLEIGLFAQVLDDGVVYQAVAAGTGSGCWDLGEPVAVSSDEVTNESTMAGITATDALTNLKNRTAQTGNGNAPPDEDTDASAGYGIGSLYTDTTEPALYFCSDPTTGAAVWNKLAIAE